MNRSSELKGLHVKVLSSLSDRRTIRTVSGLLDSWKGIMWSDITASFIQCLVSSRLVVVYEFWPDGMLEMVDFPSKLPRQPLYTSYKRRFELVRKSFGGNSFA